MKASKQRTSSLLGAAALSTTVVAAFLVACSSESSRTEYESTTTSPNDPDRPGASGPKSPDETAPDSDAPEADCKRAKPSEACGVSPQCGCSEGKTCDVVDALGSVRCVPSGDAPMGHPCTSTAGCEAGFTCVFGTCHAFCSTPGEPCSQPKTGACIQVQTTEGEEIPNFAVCRVACEPHDPTSCGGTTEAGTAVCIVDPEGNTECQTGGSRAEGETCSPSEGCGPGLACVTSEDTTTCKRWCRLDADDCGPNATCVGFSPEVLVRGVPYGACS